MMHAPPPKGSIKALIGLGNPGNKYYKTRHSIGFRVVDELADRHGGVWQTQGEADVAEIRIGDHRIILVKPLTYMNSSGKVIPMLQKKGIAPHEMLVVHDELEQPFGKVSFKPGGSHRGHNGLRSIIGMCGADFPRLRFGIARPVHKDDVSDYVLQPFQEQESEVQKAIDHAVVMIEDLY